MSMTGRGYGAAMSAPLVRRRPESPQERADRRNGEAPTVAASADAAVQPVDPRRWAERAIRALRDTGRTAAVAESLTSGAVAAALGRAPGSGRTFAGGIAPYARAARSGVLGIDATRVVEAPTAEEMASRTRELFGADVAVSLTGVAGPARQDDVEVGTVFVGWATATAVGAERHRFPGGPDDVCRLAACVALRRLHDLGRSPGP